MIDEEGGDQIKLCWNVRLEYRKSKAASKRGSPSMLGLYPISGKLSVTVLSAEENNNNDNLPLFTGFASKQGS